MEPLHLTIATFEGPSLVPRQATDVPTKAEALPARWAPSTPLVADKGASRLPLPTWDLGRWFAPPKFKRRLVTPENDGCFAPSSVHLQTSTTLLFRFHVKVQGCTKTQMRRRLQMDPELVDQLVLFAKICCSFAQQAVDKDKLNAQLR